MSSNAPHHHVISAVSLPGASSNKDAGSRRAMPVAKAYSMGQIMDSVKGNTSVARPEKTRPETPFASPRSEQATAPAPKAKARGRSENSGKRGLFSRDRFSERLSRLK
ncbi:MAG: hypothetical protein OEZ19_00780 [Paracoccaceae bacterium]|nr:hypothetical protein [Paracoccaceae bacterium]